MTLVKLPSGCVTALGLKALLEACTHSKHVFFVDLSNHDLSSHELFSSVTNFIKQTHTLRMLDLANTNIQDSHLCQLAAALSVNEASAFEMLSIASNRYAGKFVFVV